MRRVAVAVVGLALAAPAAASAAPPLKPFDHACQPQNGVRLCATKNDGQRVPSFDGVPIDVDVTLPPSGDGPFPTLVLMHGYGGSKTSFESTTAAGAAPVVHNYNNIYFAQHGYAVVTPSARGFGRSCGAPSSRTEPDCDKGWIHFADQRYELRDVQYLLGLLVDEGVTNPQRIGMSGVSYGGLQTAQFVFLKNRVRQLNGTFAPWKSPEGTPLSTKVGWVRWASGDLAYSLVPNGRVLSDRVGVPATPFGVEKKSLLTALYLGGAATGFVAPKGADPTADLAGWREAVDAGEPAKPEAIAALNQFRTFKGMLNLAGSPTPLLIQNGWTDPVFPAQDALNLYNRARKAGTPVALQLGDIGHFTGGEALGQYLRLNADGAAFLDRYLKGTKGGPASGSATVFGQGCPKGALGFGPIVAKSYTALAHGSFKLKRDKAGTITSTGGKPGTSKAIDPVTHPDRCAKPKVDEASGRVVILRKSPGLKVVGLPAVQATVKTNGKFGQIVARLWDVAKGKGRQRLVDFGIYRLKDNQKGKITFQLFGNAYSFVKGNQIKLELVGNSAPLFRASNGSFSVKVSKVRLSIPTPSKPYGPRGIEGPTVPR